MTDPIIFADRTADLFDAATQDFKLAFKALRHLEREFEGTPTESVDLRKIRHRALGEAGVKCGRAAIVMCLSYLANEQAQGASTIFQQTQWKAMRDYYQKAYHERMRL